jgi:succinate dehydrogenase/fumarate reductase flavoprotein subunit
LKKGVIKKFDNLEELAASYGIPPDELEATVLKFNDFVEKGIDEQFEKPILPDAAPLAQAPYYAIRLWPKVHFTMGGVQIDVEARVINLDGEPISGLYAAGEVTGGVHGACRLGSCAITECLVFGRIAGRNAAKPRTKN